MQPNKETRQQKDKERKHEDIKKRLKKTQTLGAKTELHTVDEEVGHSMLSGKT